MKDRWTQDRIGAAIRRLRGDLGMTQAGLAEAVGEQMAPEAGPGATAVANWERGVTPHPRFRPALARVLGVARYSDLET